MINLEINEACGAALTGVDRRTLVTVVGGTGYPWGPPSPEPPMEWPDWIRNPWRYFQYSEPSFPPRF